MKMKLLYSALVVATMSACLGCSKGGGGSSSPAPVANFTYSGNGLAPSMVTFTNTSTGASAYVWDFGDASAISTVTSPMHNYTHGGVYTVNLTATGSGGSTTITKTVNIQAPTSVKITGLKVTAMSFLDPACSCGWDATDGPDVFFKLINPGNTTVFTGPTLTNTTLANLPLSWSLSPAYQISTLTDVYKIEIWDFDTLDPNDLITSFTFNPSAAASAGYPTTVAGSFGFTDIQLTLQWQ